ncbi:MAG: DUF4349 domain-containing protein [Lachnospiraceae bacterium]|nr:DUF4349 domain-containing protein [Lachnospiraceae bacterium]
MKRKVVKSLGILMATIILMTGCGVSNNKENATESKMATEDAYEESYEEYGTEEIAEEEMADNGISYEEGATDTETLEEETTSYNQGDRKLIKTIDMELETLEYEKTITYIEKRVTKLGGYVESSSLDGSSIYDDYYGNRYGELKVRIPKEQADEFVKGIDENTNIKRKSESTEDITLSYVDAESHKEALKVEQKRLIAIMKKAETVEEIISLESRLSEVRYEIEKYESKIRTYDNLVDYTTINIYVSEVQEITEAPKITAMERMAEGFTESVNDIIKGMKEFVIGFVSALPYLVVWGIVIGVILIVIRKILKRKRKKKKIEEK